MTPPLFCQLISELTSDLSPSGFQKELLALNTATLTPEQKIGLTWFWGSLAEAGAGATPRLNLTTAMSLLASLPEVHDLTDDFFFI